MSDPVLAGDGNNPFLYYTCDRDPTATEPDVDPAVISAGYMFFWKNTDTGDLFSHASGFSGSMIWKKLSPA